MAEAHKIVDKVLFEALSAPGAVSATVYEHAPQDAPYPMVIIGDTADMLPVARAGDDDRIGRVSIIVLTEGEERLPCVQLIDQIEAALDGKSLLGDGWRICPSADGSAAMLAEDGLGYAGLVRFAVFALKD